MNNSQEKANDSKKFPRNLDSQLIKKIVLGLVLVLFILFVITLKASTYVESPEFCKKCHSMKFYYNTWVDSSHRTVKCFDCHVGYTPVKKVEPIPVTNKKYWAFNFGDSTINVSQYMNKIKDAVTVINRQVDRANMQFNFVIARSQDIKKFLSMVFGVSGNDNIAPMWNNCLACHKDLISPTSKIDNSGHSKHLANGLTCDQCHRTVTHGKGDTMSRSQCMNCHKAPLTWPSSHKTSEFRLKHGESYLKRSNCTICHVKGSKEKICMDCHGIEMPHPKDYPSIHVQSIKPVGVKTCMKCHQDVENKGTQKRDSTVTCSKCHGKGTPHKRSGKTISSHGKLARTKGIPSCLNCHNQQQDCFRCHGLEIPHPKGFLGQHTKSIRDLGFDTCIKCHDKNMRTDKICNDCHGMAMPHPQGWKGGHARINGRAIDKSACRKCHSPANPANPKASWARSDFCNSCHGIKKHDIFNHFELAFENVVCYTCHTESNCDRCH